MKELDHKQTTIDDLLKIINHMHTNSNESGENIHKNTNTQPIQINARAEEQGRNNVSVDDITFKDIPQNQTQSKEHQNEELQRNQVIENKSIITIENQLTEFRKKQQEKFTKIKKPHVSPKSNENLHKWDRNTTLIVGDSMLSGLKKEKFQKGIERSKLKTSLELRSMTCTITSSHY